jgi:hypothetical protein
MMTFPTWLRMGAAASALLVLTLAAVVVNPSVSAGDAKPAKAKVSLVGGGGEGDLKAFRAALGKIPGVTLKADDIQASDIRRDDMLFTKPFAIALADAAKTDIGAVAKAVAAADTPSKDRVPPALYLVIGYQAGGANNEQLRSTLDNVKGVEARNSFVGDVNL